MAKTILIADSCEQTRDQFKKILANRYPLIILEKPSQSLDILNGKTQTALVFIECVKRSRSKNKSIFTLLREKNKDLTVIALGEKGGETDAVEAVRAGASGYMIKPLDHHEVISIAGKIC